MFTAPRFFSGINILHQCYSVGAARPEYAVTDLSVCALLSLCPSHLQLSDISVQVVYICALLQFFRKLTRVSGDGFLEVGDAKASGGSGQDRVSSEGRDLSLI